MKYESALEAIQCILKACDPVTRNEVLETLSLPKQKRKMRRKKVESKFYTVEEMKAIIIEDMKRRRERRLAKRQDAKNPARNPARKKTNYN